MIKIGDISKSVRCFSTKFQFHSGLIKSKYKQTQKVGYSEFQFHSGLIKSNDKAFITKNTKRFQFHSGLIKRSLWGPTDPVNICFNSILV